MDWKNGFVRLNSVEFISASIWASKAKYEKENPAVKWEQNSIE